MTDRAKKKEDAKKEIRSLLLSAPLGLTVNELQRDFLEFMFKPLPWKDLGYSSPEDFVQDLRDTVQVSWGAGGMLLTAVADKATKHIENMVSRQKVDTRKKRKVTERRMRQANQMPFGGARRGGGGWSGPGRTHGPPLMGGPPRMQSWQQNQYQRARHLMAQPTVPAYVRGQIAELLDQHSDGLPLTHFAAIFRNRYGVALDYRGMGFSTEQDLLSSLRDIVGLRYLAGGETRVLSINYCVAWNNSAGGQHPANGGRNIQASKPLLPNPNFRQNQQATKPNMSNALQALQDKQAAVLKAEQNTLSQPVVHGKGRGRGGVKVSSSVPGGLSNSNSFAGKMSTERQNSSNTDSGRDSIELEQNCLIPMPVQDEIRQIMNRRPKGITASRLPFEYKNLHSKTLSVKSYGYNSVIEFVSDMPHIIRIERPHPQGDWHLLSAQPSSGSDAPQPSGKTDAGNKDSAVSNRTISPPLTSVDKTIKDSIAQVLCINPDGIPLDDFLQTFKAVIGRSLDVDKYGPGGLKRLLHSLSDILIISLDASDKTIVLPKMQSGPRRFDLLQDEFKPISTDAQKSDTVLHLPTDAVSPGCRFNPQTLPGPGEADKGNYIELYVSNVISPGMFWIQLRGRNTTLALEDLMDELESTYSSKHLSKEYNMTTQLAQVGMVCAVIFPEDSFWHRGLITALKDQLYQVYFVDYGNSCLVSIDQMRLLKSKFVRLPAQAIQAKLGNINPVAGSWNHNSKARMLALARDKPLVGLVLAEKDRVLSLCLTDTSKDDDIHFNDVFVDEGYAFFEPDIDAGLQLTHEQAPSSTFLYGPSSVPEQTGHDGQQETPQRYVAQAKMMEDMNMYLINVDGTLYLMSAQISALFFPHDVIRSKLRQSNIEIMAIVVTKNDYAKLFVELLGFEAPEVDEKTECLNLIALKCLPLIIELYGGKDDLEELKASALEILDWFDPDDPFWKGEDVDEDMAEDNVEQDDEDEVRTQCSSDVQPSIDDFRLVLNTFEMKRKRILARMMDESSPPEYVNELFTVELQIKRVKELLSKHANKQASDTFARDSAQLSETSNQVLHQPQAAAQSTDSSMYHSQSKTPMNKVAPMVQNTAKNTPSNSCTEATLNPPPLIPAMDQMALLQQQMLMNQILLQQSGLSTPNPSLLAGSQMLNSGLSSGDACASNMFKGFGRGLPMLGEQQLQQLQLLQAGLMPGSYIPNSQQLLAQQQLNTINTGLSGLSLHPTITSTASTLPSPSTPPGLAASNLTNLGLLPGFGRGQLTMNPAPQGGGLNMLPQNSMLGSLPSSGLHTLFQQHQQQRPK